MGTDVDYVPVYYPTLKDIKNETNVDALLIWLERVIALQHNCIFSSPSMHSFLKLAKLKYCGLAKEAIKNRIKKLGNL